MVLRGEPWSPGVLLPGSKGAEPQHPLCQTILGAAWAALNLLHVV